MSTMISANGSHPIWSNWQSNAMSESTSNDPASESVQLGQVQSQVTDSRAGMSASASVTG
jgi:hypothetical protein